MLRTRHAHVTNPNAAHRDGLSRTDRIAKTICDHIGTFAAFSGLCGLCTAWMFFNLIPGPWPHWDAPPAFQLLLLCGNFVQLFLMPLLMVAQNMDNRHAEARGDAMYRMNLTTADQLAHIIALLENDNANR